MKFGVVVFPGSNCDEDAYHAAKDVFGQDAEYLWHKNTDLKGSDVVILPGGFAHGDYLRTGAMARFSPIMRDVRRFADAGGPVLGICNGFQILLEAGLLPGAMLRNRGLKYRCEHVHCRVGCLRRVQRIRPTNGWERVGRVLFGSGTPAMIDPQTLERHGLKPDEYARIVAFLGRAPNLTELGIFSVMWSEHCSYKSSRVHLKTLPTKGPQVLQGPGENAGAVDIGEGLAAVFKIESHNHPSFIEPYQGAATGVGGIIRDIFTMGARPIALLNSLRFGALDAPGTKRLLEGVVAGVAGYGNSIGIPTVGGEIAFEPSYAGNPLVNVFCLGIAKQTDIIKGVASGVGNAVYYVGAKTGRDGIHGATKASAEFDDKSAEKRPAVQVGDPFMEKLLQEACLEVMRTEALVVFQEMGAAGLTCSTTEMGSRGGAGVEIDIAHVPQRETGMTPYEIMLSESQERMLLVVKRGREADVERIFDKWDLHACHIGEVTTDGMLRVKDRGTVVAEIPNRALTDEAPVYRRPMEQPEYLAEVQPLDLDALDGARRLQSSDQNPTLLMLLGSP